MKSVVLLLLAAIQLSAAYNYNSYSRYSPPTPPKPTYFFTFEKNFQTALQTSQAEGKPILVIVHRTYCKACKDLFADLPKNQDMQTVAKKYVVVHSIDESDLQLESLGPRTDRYFPRFFFYDRNGNMMPIKNENNRNYPFYFATAKELAKAMNKGIASGQY